MLCPICKRGVPEDGPCYPFCSERCKLIDLGKWASEGYVIPAPIEPEPSSEEDSE